MKVRVRYGKHFNEFGQEQVLTCNYVSGQWVAGFVPGIQVNNWVDITQDIDGINIDDSVTFDISFKKSIDGIRKREKGGTSSIYVVGESKQFILDWLEATPCSELNFLEVEITLDCGIVLDLYEIRPDNITYSHYDPICAIDFPMIEQDQQKNFLERTSIMDNWQNWFAETKDFNTVEVCYHNMPIMHSINVGLIMFVQGFGTVPGTSVGLGSLISGILDLDLELDKNMGFGHFMPCPTIQEVLDNFTAKHGWITISPFHSLPEYELDAIFIPLAGDFNENNLSCNSNYEKFKFNNTEIKSCLDFIVELCKLYNMEYSLNSVTKQLILEFIKDKDLSPVLFTFNEEDIIDHKKVFQPEKRFASTKLGYNLDGADSKSNTVKSLYNTIVSNTNNITNPLFQGINDRMSNFSPLGFWGDGFGTDYLHDIPEYAKLIAIVLSSLFALIASIQLISIAFPFVGANAGGPIVTLSPGGLIFWTAIELFAIAGIINSFVYASDIRDNYAYDSCHEGAVHLYGTGQKSNISIIRLEPNRDLNDAKVVTTPVNNIIINPKYNTSTISWNNQWSSTAGYPRSKAFNYPLFFDEKYIGNMYDTLYEKTINITYQGASNSLIEIQLLACCDYLEFFGFNNESNRKEGVILNWNYKGVWYLGEILEVTYRQKENLLIIKTYRYR